MAKAASDPEMFRALFERAPDAMLIADDERRYLDANPAACRLLGLSREELRARRIDDFIEPGTEVALEQAWSAFIQSGERAGDFRLRRADGTPLIVEYNAKANFLPGHHLSILRDITPRRTPEVGKGGSRGRLTPREFQVLELIADGHTGGEIARRLRVSMKTVETYRSRIREKFNLKSRADLVRFAHEIGLQ